QRGVRRKEPQVLRLGRHPLVEPDQSLGVVHRDRAQVGSTAVGQEDVGLPVRGVCRLHHGREVNPPNRTGEPDSGQWSRGRGRATGGDRASVRTMWQNGIAREESAATQAFRQARDFRLAHREDYDTAYRDFRWPELDRFNWARDWFDRLAMEQAESTAL